MKNCYGCRCPKAMAVMVLFIGILNTSVNAVAVEAQMVKDISSLSSNSSPLYLTDINGTVFFRANDGVHGNELWKSDGSEAGTVLVKDIRNGSGSSAPSEFLRIGDILFFRAKDDANGNELWRSDGSAEGTFMVKDIQTGDADTYPDRMTHVNGTLFFRADDGSGDGLWKSDGTEQGTVLVKTVNPNSLTTVNGSLFFTYSDSETDEFEVWISDGTGAGTHMLKDINPDGPSYPSYLTAVGDTLFFRAGDNVTGLALWKSDGTEEGTVMVKDMDPETGNGSGGPRDLVNVEGLVYFTVCDSGDCTQLWKSDGTADGTVKVATIHPTAYLHVKNLTAVGDMLFFVVYESGVPDFNLWRSDGSEDGTFMVKNFRPAEELNLDDMPDNLTDVYGTLFFSADDGVNGMELWQSDGTEAGTFMAEDIAPGDDSNPRQFCISGSTLFFSADDGTYGKELWKLPVDNGALGFEDIEFWVGTGSNQAMFVVDWNDGKDMESLVWGYRWDGDATGEDMLRAIMYADSDLYAYLEHWDSPEGYTLYGMGYDIDEDGFGYMPGTGGIGHNSNDDGYPLDSDDHWAEGWMTGYWSYWLSDGSEENWEYSGVGMSARELSDGDWDGWSFASDFSVFATPPDDPQPLAHEYSPFAVEVVDFNGEFGPEPYNSPEALLGKPATHFKDMNANTGRIKLVEPAWIYGTLSNPLITTLNTDEFVTVKFDHQVEDDPRNPYGIDLIVFGNSFFVAPGGGVSDGTNMNEITLPGGGFFQEQVKVSVSPDGENWYTYEDGPYGDTLYPTQAYQWDSENAQWTDDEMDWTLPVDPNLTENDFTGITGAAAIALYKGSAGGTGYDLSESGFEWIQYVRLEGMSGTGGTTGGGEVDALADVAPLDVDFNQNGRIDLPDAIMALQIIAEIRASALPVGLNHVIYHLAVLTGVEM